MANYSQLSAGQQAAVDNLLVMLSPLVGQFARLLNQFQACDAQYLSVGSAALTAMASSEFTGTNLAATVGNSVAPLVTSVTHNFTADEVGNFVNITAGTNWTTGLYEIRSVAANAATLDRACATVASPTTGTWAILATAPNKVNLSQAAPTLARADIVSMIAHLESALTTFNDQSHRNLWVKAAGPANLV